MTTKPQRLRLLLVEDVEDDAQLLMMQLREGWIEPDFVRVESAAELKAALENGPWDVVFADYSLPSFTGLDAMRIMQESGLDLPFILVSGVIGEEQAVEAMKAGAHDFILKGQYARLLPALKRALSDAALRHERRQTAEELSRYRGHLEELVQQRTEDLAAANEELQAQREVLQEQREELAVVNEKLQAHAAELEAVNLELEAFNYSVAHDLRQPLNNIGMNCQAIKMICGDRLSEQCTGFLQESYEGVLRMNSLIGALLNFSCMSRVEPRRNKVDLSALAHEVVTMLKRTASERRVDFRIAAGITAEADANLLRSVLENLLGNAWKYTGMREEAVIEFGVTEIDGKPVYFVRDNGAGFDNADMDKLFVPFKRLPGAEEFRGFGIGLATVERIIRRHGGRMCAEGEPGKGATFYFTLPAKD
ncbi:MAG TPA: ATP-binding protein [Dongiaceae bacterium]|nr:ATP-binding protein [Dongiaceae bacterium]